MKGKTTNQLQEYKKEVNTIINSLYEEIAQAAFKLDKFRVPLHGIDQPSLENPVNLFQRQMKIEQLSFELAHEKYKNSLNDLIKIGRADQLATSHRYILQWVRSLETAISEQQKIFVKRGSMDSSKVGYYLLSMPSEQIASICVLHIMRHLFSEFVSDIKSEADKSSQIKDVQVDVTS